MSCSTTKSPATKKMRFTRENDETIKKLIVGDDRYQDWNKIAQNIPGKSARQCRERYQRCLKPGLNKGKWTLEEDKIIKEMYSQYGPNWALMAKSLKGRTNNNIKNRWNNHLKHQVIPAANSQNQNRLNTRSRRQIEPQLTAPVVNQNQNNNLQMANNTLNQWLLATKRQKFTKEEDEMIKKLIVGDDRYQDWNKIAQNMPWRTPKQCRDRYQNYLKPGLNKDEWTLEEDKIIKEMYSQYGPNWALMAKSLKGRTNNDIKNRWNNHLRRQIEPQLTAPVVINQNQNNNHPQNQPTEQTNNDSVADFDLDFFGKPDDFDFNQNGDMFPNSDIFDNQFDGFYHF